MDHDEMRAAMRRATEPQVVIHSDPDGRWVLWQADCRTILSRLPDNCVDAIVTDPPYGIEFMGKEWDSFSPEPVVKRSGHDKAAGGGFSETANGSKLPNYGGTKTFECAGCGRRDAFRKKCKCENPSWMRVNVHGNLQALAFQEWTTSWAREALRVLKPGGHLLAFGGSRTYHRLACAVEDAGFEIRDQIMWVYGSGFPKSLDVGKAIDKTNGEPDRLLRFTLWFRSIGITPKQVGQILRDAGLITENGTMAGHYFAKSLSGQPAIPTAGIWTVLRPHCGDVPEWVDELVARIEAEREVVGIKTAGIANKDEGPRHTIGAGKAVEVNITSPATDAAKQWQGWGTALKPAHEPIVVARKPLEGTVAANVLKWGTGALNIDGTRVGDGGDRTEGGMSGTNASNVLQDGFHQERMNRPEGGRWPANFIHDGSDEVLALAGSAARFFYCAKASKAERNAGLGHLPERDAPKMDGGPFVSPTGNDSTKVKAQNHHPTVKPIALMRYLIRLVTPPGGVVLDPFAGSGTTMVAALMEGAQPWGCEMTADYVPIILGRVGWALDEVESRIEGTL